MYWLLVFRDIKQENLIFIGRYKNLSNINRFTDGLIRYSDVEEKDKKYTTYKNFFKIIKEDTFEKV